MNIGAKDSDEPRGQEGSLSSKCRDFFSRCLLSHQEESLKEGDSIWRQLKFALLCPPHGFLGKWLGIFVLILGVYGALLGILGRHAEVPNGVIFQIFVLLIVAVLMGKVVEMLRLPPLLGMILTGIFFENMNWIVKEKEVWNGISSKLRGLALVIILLKAGLGLDPKALKKLSGS
ncbi:Mitochondrial sodium/hydrogen exchanger 9B2like, partial [Caligus rogercresseyi]